MFSFKFWKRIQPQTLTLDGTVYGVVTINKARLFRIGQEVILKADSTPDKRGNILYFLDNNSFIVGDTHNKVLDLTSFTVANNATIEALKQHKKEISNKYITREAFETEPVVAFRTTNVDENGDYVGSPTNPINITTNNNQYKKFIEEIGTDIYIGTAIPGTTETEALWSIKKIECPANEINILWANATTDFIHIWQDKETYPYS